MGYGRLKEKTQEPALAGNIFFQKISNNLKRFGIGLLLNDLGIKLKNA